MARVSSRFVCQECGSVFPKWLGQCEVCKAWNSITEELVSPQTKSTAPPVPDDFFSEVGSFSGLSEDFSRHQTELSELNRVLGGGLVDGSVILIGGHPGIGKSTLLMQILEKISGIDKSIYISAEESVKQVALRANRLKIQNPNVHIASSSNISQILSAISKVTKNSIVIIDSIQTISSDSIQSPPGSISQVRFCTQELVNFAKSHGVVVVIVGHITKDGTIAGPKTLEHMVDTVLYFEGEKNYDYRIIRCIKNRFGPTDEICVFSMTEQGLKEVENPSVAFLSEHSEDVSGVSVFAGIEGTRPLLSEIQALVSNTSIPVPKRTAIGFDFNRLSMLIAVLSRRCRLNFSNKEVYLNVAGGLKISEPAADLAVIAAVLSSFFQKPFPKNSVFFGEVSLAGEIRQSYMAFSRIREAAKLGFNRIYCSTRTEHFDHPKDVQILKLASVKDLLSCFK